MHAAQALNSILEQEKPDYDMDSEDEKWVKEAKLRVGVDINPDQFEEMIDRLEKSCGKQVQLSKCETVNLRSTMHHFMLLLLVHAMK